MDEAFERVVAENRELRKELKTLRERTAAVEASRWWRLHPRVVARRLRGSHNGSEGVAAASPAKLARLAQSWRMKVEHERRNAGRPPDEIVLRDGISLKVHPNARGSLALFCYGEPEQVEELDVFIANTANRQRLLDVGAFHGAFSLVFAANDRTKRALAVDASPISFPTLLYNIHRNGADNITAVERALSNVSGTLEMHFTYDYAVAGSAAEGSTLVAIETETGDRLCRHYAFEPDVVKIDVEGHELRVLEGLRSTIVSFRPLVFLEVHPRMIAADSGNGTLLQLVDELRGLGYQSAELRRSVVPVEKIAELVEIERLVLRAD